jgi:eukaryotic-like serine/threonine-protein kinase
MPARTSGGQVYPPSTGDEIWVTGRSIKRAALIFAVQIDTHPPMSHDNVTPESSSTQAGATRSPGGPSPVPVIPDHQLLRRIGRGSYGEVWLARNMMGEYRAVKIIYRESFQEQRPFDRELSGIRKFEPVSRTHDGFIDILHVGINEEAGYFYYLMELGDDQTSGPNISPEDYIPKTLAKYVALHGILSTKESVQLGLALSLALNELHKHGLVHRDVKPSNIIFVNGIPKLADIGLVAEVNEARSYVGTEGFIPPEGPGSAQADIYSLGKTLYEVSTGKDRHDFPQLPTSLESFPDLKGFLELNEVMMHACANDLKARYHSAWDIHTDLVVLAAGKSVRRLKILERRLANIKRVAGFSALVLLVLAGVFYQVYREWKGRIESRERQVGSSIAYGNQAMESGNLLGSLPHFADALRLDSGNLSQATTHRLRMGSILAQCPKLTHLWSEGIQVNEAEFGPDGKRVLVAEFQGSLKVYDLKGEIVRTQLFGSTEWLWGAQFSPDGLFVATANGDGSARVFDALSLKELYRLPHNRAVNSVRFSADGRRLITSCRDGIARVWDLATKQVQFSITHSREVKFADFSPDGLLIVTTSEDNTARLWDANKGEARGVLPHPGWVYYAAFSPDNKRVVTACSDHKARVWDVSSGQRIKPDLNHGDVVMSTEFSPDGRLILTSSLDGTARLWLADSLQPIALNSIIRHGERLMHASFSRDGRQIIISGADGTVRVWDLAGAATLPNPVPYVISEDGSRFCLVTNKSIEVEDIESGNPIGPLIHTELEPEEVVLSPDGRFVAGMTRLGSSEGTHVQVWNVGNAAPLGPGFAISNAPSGLALTGDGSHVVTFGANMAQSWNVLTGSALSGPVVHVDPVESAFFSPDGARFATITGRELEIRDARTGQLVFPPLSFLEPVHSAKFSRDGSKVVGSCSDQFLTKCYAQVWGATDGRPVGPRLMHGDGVLDASFSPDGRRVVTASEDFTATEWDSTTGRRLISSVQHDEKVRTAAYSPDGKWFVTASIDKTARVWNAETGDPLTPPLRHLTNLIAAAFLADGRHIATHDWDKKCRIWALPVDQRPVNDLVALSRLLSGYTEARFGQLSLHGSESLETIWKRLRGKYPGTFATSLEEIEKWHEFLAQEADIQQQWTVEAFHLQQLLALRPGDKSIIKKSAMVQQHLPR